MCTLRAKEGKIDELIAFSKQHFVHQLDGREPKAYCATLVMPTPEEPNTIRLVEQWDDAEGLDYHRSTSLMETWKATVLPLLVEPIDFELVTAPMIFYAKK